MGQDHKSCPFTSPPSKAQRIKAQSYAEPLQSKVYWFPLASAAATVSEDRPVSLLLLLLILRKEQIVGELIYCSGQEASLFWPSDREVTLEKQCRL